MKGFDRTIAYLKWTFSHRFLLALEDVCEDFSLIATKYCPNCSGVEYIFLSAIRRGPLRFASDNKYFSLIPFALKNGGLLLILSIEYFNALFYLTHRFLLTPLELNYGIFQCVIFIPVIVFFSQCTIPVNLNNRKFTHLVIWVCA